MLTMIAISVLATAADDAAGKAVAYGPRTAIQPLAYTAVRLTDPFWAPRLETNRKVTIWHELEQCEITRRISDFAAAAGKGGPRSDGYLFNDSDLYKVLEAAAYALATDPEAKLEQRVDEIIELIAGAQEEDGYLCTAVTAGKREGKAVERWDTEWVEHELYNVGHLYEAAAAYFRATGKRKLLDVALKNADLICATFHEKGRRHAPGHQEIEMGLVKLFEVTGNRKYLEQAKWFLDERGNKARPKLFGEYSQDHIPVWEQDKAVGHAVRAAYMYCAMIDVGTQVGDSKYVRASEKIWRDVAQSKTYLTGGIGSSGSNEGFAAEYALPNLNGYAETCASIANVFWNQRLFMETGEAKYIDVLERALYNATISGHGMEGRSFFYPNPLLSITGHARSAWFACACCPPNVARLLASLPQYFYAADEKGIYANLFAASEAKTALKGVVVHLKQATEYPWEGRISLHVDPAKEVGFRLRLRIPGWASGAAFGGDLYVPVAAPSQKVSLKVNGVSIPLQIENGYAVIDRQWKKGDTVTLELPMEPTWYRCHEKVVENIGRLALQRGPLVYCAEFADQPDQKVLGKAIDAGSEIRVKKRTDLGGLVELGVAAHPYFEGKGAAVRLNLIPYYAWAHRGRGQMAVWLAADAKTAQEDIDKVGDAESK